VYLFFLARRNSNEKRKKKILRIREMKIGRGYKQEGSDGLFEEIFKVEGTQDD